MSVIRYRDPICDLEAWITVPTDFDREKESLPLILFLHGVGERDILENVKAHGIPKLFCADPDYHGLRVITVSPCCKSPNVWNNFAMQVYGMLLRLIDEYNANPDAVTVTGLSMGGYGTWDIATAYASTFAAAAPICGGGMVWRARYLKDLPIRAFHADNDDVVPYYESVNMVEAINRAGGKATLTNCPGWGHGSWVPAYEESDLIEWLAAARRK